ncbi:hypothetical protein INT43_008469 [Umbelopsis isabellina]|uniref:Uncharacterized protein n=1 Tax=Mortierella isabellina TaxID=91625 RepID=A0A8H7PWR7_MORIS|nr:hypothetical protein INT43_008469 [Umbelopsis isabellina]
MSSFRGSPVINNADIARSPRFQSTSPGSWDAALTPEDKQAYAKFFKVADEEQKGFITGQEAVKFFAKSGVPSQILAEIWEAVDKEGRGFLTPESFAMALKLISCAQHGYETASPLLSTAVPLPQFEGISITSSPQVASPFQTQISESNSNVGAISAAAREKYSKMFQMAHPVNGVLTSDAARGIFMKSNLSVDQLALIWNLADTRSSGTLNQTEFIIAMHYIAGTMDGSISTLPSSLPPHVYKSAAGNLAPSSPIARHFSGETSSFSPSFTQRFPMSSPSFQKQTPARQFTGSPLQSQVNLSATNSFAAASGTDHSLWDVTEQEKQKYDTYFDRIDSNRTGVIQGNDAVEFFQNSRLPEAELAQVWDLADTQQRGKLSREEFAVAMHLIHKRIGGQPIPRQLPATLMPPSQRPSSQLSSAFNNSNLTSYHNPVVSSPAVRNQAVSTRSLLDDTDLLGDFDNSSQITTETNHVNQLQNQISDTIQSTNDLRKQKMSVEETLAQLQKQKQDFSTQLSQLQLAFNQENGDLQKLQEQLSSEEPDLQRIRQEAETAETNLTLLRNQQQELEQKIKDGRAESEHLRRRVTEIQDETKFLKLEIQNLQSTSRKQDMMLDVNRRQVTAAEMDKSATTRELNEVREERGLSPRAATDPVQSELKPLEEHNGSLDSPSLGGHLADASQPAVSPTSSRPPTAQSFTQQSSPFAHAFQSGPESVASPSMTMNSFDAAFEDLASPSLNNSLPKERPFSPFNPAANRPSSATSGTYNDFEARNDTASPFHQSEFSVKQPATTAFDDAFGDLDDTNSNEVPGRESNTAVPPTAFDDSFLRTKGTNLAVSIEEDSSDDEEFLTKSPSKKATDAPTANASNQANFDDFEKAFTGNMDAAQEATPAGANAFDSAFDTSYAEFDETFDKPHQADKPSSNSDKGKSKFGAFDFSDFESELGATTGTAGNGQNDLDSIFGATAGSGNNNNNAASTAEQFSFDDAFGSFKEPPPASSGNTGPAAPSRTAEPVAATAKASEDQQEKADDKPEIKQLIGMGFTRSQAVDALRRYDNDLEKATNYLLDN